MAVPPETNLVNRIRRVIRTEHPIAWVMKTHGGPYQDAGLPDLFVMVEGRFIALEVKCPRPGETDAHARSRTTDRQKHQLAVLERAGATVGVVLSPREALTVIQQAIGTARYHRVREQHRRPRQRAVPSHPDVIQE